VNFLTGWETVRFWSRTLLQVVNVCSDERILQLLNRKCVLCPSHVWTAILCQLVVLSCISVLCSRWVFWHFSRTYCLHLLGDWYWFTWMLQQQLGRMFQLHGKATGNMANQSCEKCSVLLALSFPHSYNFPVFLPHFSVYRKWRQYIPPEHSSTTQCKNPKEDHQLTFLTIIILIMLFLLLLSLPFWEDVCSRGSYSLVCLLKTWKYPNQLSLALSITVQLNQEPTEPYLQ